MQCNPTNKKTVALVRNKIMWCIDSGGWLQVFKSLQRLIKFVFCLLQLLHSDLNVLINDCYTLLILHLIQCP